MGFFRNIPTIENEALPYLHEVDFSELASDLAELAKQSDISRDMAEAADEVTGPTGLRIKYPRLVSLKDSLEMLQMDLSLSGVNSVLLHGPKGIGKTSLVEGLIRNRAEGRLTSQLMNKPYFIFDTTAFFTQSSQEDPVVSFNIYLDKAAERQGLLIIDHMDDLVRMSGPEAERMVNSLVSKLEHNPAFQSVILCETENLDKIKQLSTGVARRFIQRDLGKEPRLDEMEPYLMAHFVKYSQIYNVNFTEEAATEIIRLLKRYPGRAFTESRPGNVIRFANMVGQYVNRKKYAEPTDIAELREKIGLLEDQQNILRFDGARADGERKNIHTELTSLRLAYEKAESEWRGKFDIVLKKQKTLEKFEQELAMLRDKTDRSAAEDQKFNLYSDNLDKARADVVSAEKSLYPEPPTIHARHVRAVFALESGVPESTLNESKQARLAKLDGFLDAEIVKQDVAKKVLSLAYYERENEISDPSRPAGVFMFVGGSGLGKSELSKVLARFDGGDGAEPLIIRLSEYKGSQAGKRLTGADPGYAGYEDGSSMDEVRKNPRAIILLDEIEKADNSVPDTLMQVLEDGKLTVSNCKEPINFKDTIIVMTSNALNTTNVPPDKWRDSEYLREKLAEVVNPDTGKKQFKPEFIGRIDEVVLFENLEPADNVPIFQKGIRSLNNDYEEKGITLEVSDEAASAILQAHYDPTSGGRLARGIIKKLVRPLVKDFIVSHPATAMGDEDERYDAHLKLVFDNGKLSLASEEPRRGAVARPDHSTNLNAA